MYIESLRKEYGLSQSDIDRILKVQAGTCSRWEKLNNAPEYVVSLLRYILKEA